MNSREKGKRGERQWRDVLDANGYPARRGQQFSGSPDSPDVICDALPWAHFEVKLAERFNLYAAMEQARRDCMGESRKQKAESRNSEGSAKGKVPFVAHRRNYWPWLVTMDAGRFYQLLQGDLTGGLAERMAGGEPESSFAELPGLLWEVWDHKRLTIHEMVARAKREGMRQPVLIAHRRAVEPPANPGRWLITMEAETFFRLLRGDFSGGKAESRNAETLKCESSVASSEKGFWWRVSEEPKVGLPGARCRKQRTTKTKNPAL